MTQIDWTRAGKYFLLMDFIKGFGLGLKYFFAPKATLNYPHEKGPLAWVVIVAFFAQFGAFGGAYAGGDTEPDQISAYMERYCTPEFIAVDEGFLVEGGFAELYVSEIGTDGGTDGWTVNDHVARLVLATHIGAYVGVAGRDSVEDKYLSSFGAWTNLVNCLDSQFDSLNSAMAPLRATYLERGILADSNAIVDAAEAKD